MNRIVFPFVLLTAVCQCLSSPVDAGETGPDKKVKHAFTFRDVAKERGLFPELTEIQGHGAAWGDVDGDGWLDLYVGTFHTKDAKPNVLLRNRQGKFRADPQKALRISTRATGVIFVDLDNDGDLDLYVGSMPADKDSRKGQREGMALRGCSLFRNDGKGTFTDISAGNGACPDKFGGRSATALDYDGDGLLDLLVGSDPFPGYNGSPSKSSRLFRNLGKLQFKDVSRDVGLPENTPGLGVASADVNNDGLPDFFLASSDGGNVLMLNQGKGRFVEAAGSRELFAWKDSGGDNMVCGVCIADINRDDLPDIVLGQHYSSPWKQGVPIRLYLNRGIKVGIPAFVDVTDKVGLPPLPMKAPHVEFQDFDNDGFYDLYASTVKFADGNAYPLIFRHLGLDASNMPKFQEDILGVNDFPTAEDRAIKRGGDFYKKFISEKKIIYMAPGPSGDFDNDGRLDLFLPNWWVESPSLLLHNETPSTGNWLRIAIEAQDGVNRMGIGSRIRLYELGKLGDRDALLASRDLAVGYGYASGQAGYAHFGLGERKAVEVEVVLPHGKGKIVHKGAKANQRLTLKP